MINPLNRLVLVARTIEKARAAAKQVCELLPNDGFNYTEHILPLECDHCSLQSVRDFVVELRRVLRETYRIEKWAYSGIDALCLNAAVLVADGASPQFTEDDLETTFQTNHLSPFLIANLAADLINPGGRVVFSTSGLHVGSALHFDGVIEPSTGNIRKGFTMLDGSPFHFKRSYTIAKLCNVATCVDLNKRLRAKSAISTCFSPGLMITSGLFRHQLDPVRPIPPAHREAVLRKAKSVEWGAGSLVFMALADETGQRGAEYWSDTSFAGCQAEYGKQFCASPITDDMIDEKRRKTLWIISCRLAGIECDLTAKD